jgi:hypothetical protein
MILRTVVSTEWYNDVGWCVPVMKLTGNLQKIFKITDCHAISGLTCQISYNGKLPIPSKIFFIELDKDGKVIGKKTRLIYPELEPGKTGHTTFRINSVLQQQSFYQEFGRDHITTRINSL